MSIASLGIIGGLAGTQLPQRAAATENVQQGQGEQSRAAEAAQRAEAAAGIGTTEEDAETSDRDADGRRLWERTQTPAKTQDPSLAAEAAAESLSKDPSGACGGQLDLLG
jgi:hypothetical protein